MKIALLQIKTDKKGFVNKDVSGGMGTVSHFGNSFMARLLTWLKKKGVGYPVLTLGYLAGILKKNGHEVIVSNNIIPESDLTIIYSSIVDFKNEVEFAKRIKEQTSSKVCIVGPFASVMPEIYLPYADFIIKGEPEAFFVKLGKNSSLPKGDRKSTRLNSSHIPLSRMPSSA